MPGAASESRRRRSREAASPQDWRGKCSTTGLTRLPRPPRAGLALPPHTHTPSLPSARALARAGAERLGMLAPRACEVFRQAPAQLPNLARVARGS